MKRTLSIFTSQEAFLLVAACMFIGLFIGLVLQGLTTGLEHPQTWENVAVLVAELLLLGPAILVLKLRKIPILDVLPLKRSSFITYFMTGVLVMGVLGLISVFEVLIIPYFPVPDFLKQLEVDLAQSSFLDTAILMLAAIIAAPLAEEILFRGLLQQSLFYKYGSLIPAIIIPTMVFSLFHVAYLLYIPALTELIVLALILAGLMVKTGNILVSMLAHALFNLSSFFAVFTMDLESVTTLSDLGWVWILGSSFLFIVAGVYFKLMPLARFENVNLIPPLISQGDPNA